MQKDKGKKLRGISAFGKMEKSKKIKKKRQLRVLVNKQEGKRSKTI